MAHELVAFYISWDKRTVPMSHPITLAFLPNRQATAKMTVSNWQLTFLSGGL